MRVAIIGAGPAALAAAHAAFGLADEVRIFAPKRKTPQRGPIMLHRPIPGINNSQPDGYVRQIVIGGSILDYRLKLYGDVNIKINGDVLEPGFHTWRVQTTYDDLWHRYSDLIEDCALEPSGVAFLAEHFDLVVNTAPVPNICEKPGLHKFESVQIAVVLRASYPNQPANTVVYNSYPDIKWVRSSRIFEAACTEYRPEDAPADHIMIRKPLSTNCNCHPKILRTGRFGSWHNETWIDHAYYDVRTALVSMRHENDWDSVI